MQKKWLPLLCILTLLLLAACQTLDVVARDSTASFDALLSAMKYYIGPDDSIGGYALHAPDGSARFLWSRDFSTSVYDAWLETDIMPFVEAGLNTAKLSEGVVHEGLLIVGADFGSRPPSYTGEATPQKAYGEIVKYKRDSITYHAALDHFSIDLGGGHLFEWAKNLQSNDKDIVFVLDPKPFYDAGADPEKIPGWIFAKVETMDLRGNKILEDKLLKPFNVL